ncbi:33 kDa ribonucleoprotein, chloroplastic-like isoform X2 [Gastrolobium bilobum]|uniref:33 kDa ribonucleoprotein, chloroplastic-like isoform X2 n=1 Tax=Gastrolobium bilobum TaxID=150636 RepID=UPI002AB1EDD3|nr:33 kDa ribonucleoprotein, chloroplastic-like isoform X2 [Gastrolobium bilobum]
MSMASTPTASSSICNRIYILSFTNSSISHTLNFPQRTKSPKPLNLKPKLFTISHLSPYHLHLPSVSSHNFQVTQEDPEPETFQKSEPKVSHSNQSERLFVGNLPYSLPSSQLAELFGEAGNVVSVEIVYDDITDRSRGFAFVTMGSVEDAEQAIRMFDGSQVGGRIIKVNVPKVPKGDEGLVMGSKYKGYVDSPHKIYAGNLDWGLTSQGLRDAFAEQPGLLSAKVIYERNRGKSRGYGFVTFETAKDVEAALNDMNGDSRQTLNTEFGCRQKAIISSGN